VCYGCVRWNGYGREEVAPFVVMAQKGRRVVLTLLVMPVLFVILVGVLSLLVMPVAVRDSSCSKRAPPPGSLTGNARLQPRPAALHTFSYLLHSS